jgi:DNA-binding MarR family transcriptional regulator
MLDLSADELDRALEAFHLAFRALVAVPDELLRERGFGRAHHRILYLVRRRPGATVGQLMDALGITKQALNGPLRALVDGGLVVASTDARDARAKRLRLTAAGRRLEHALTGDQHARLRRAFALAGPRKSRHWSELMALVAAG